MAEIVLPEGFLPLVTEGSLASGGESDVRRPHLPENVGVFRAYQASDGKAQRYTKSTKYPTSSIFAKSDDGAFVLKEHIKGEARYAVTASRAGAGEAVGTFPNYSGLTIGMGCDMGASYSKASQVESLFNFAAELSGDVALVGIGKQLGEAAGKRGMIALAVTNNLRKAIQLTPQQVLNLQNAMWKRKEKGIAGFIKNGIVIGEKKILNGGIFDYNKLYEPLKQIFVRAAYSNLYRVASIAENLKGIDSLNPIQQCDKMLESFRTYDYDKCVKYGFVAIVEKFKSELSKGNTIKIQQGPIQLADLLDPNKPVGDWMTEIRKSAKNDKKDFREKLRADLVKQGIDPGKPNSNPPINPTPTNEETNNSNDNNDSDDDNNNNSTSIVELVKMAMAGKGSIKGKVGIGGDNNAQDVIVIKALLNSHGYYDFTFNPMTIISEMLTIGKSDSKLEAAITKFQTDKGAKKPDGRVDPNGTTLRWLNEPKTAANVTPPVVETPTVVTPPVVETPTNNTTTPANNGKQLVIHEAVLALGTEGVPCGENSLDVRLPHWPGYVSGVSIGVGFDIGASKITADELQNVMGILGVPKAMVDELAKTVNVQAEPARDLLASLKLREKVRITQQQAIDIMVIMKQKIGASTRRAFSTSFATAHPAVIEVLHKFAYGAPALVLGYPNGGFKGLGPMYDAKLAAISDPKAQCDLCAEMCDAVTAHFGPTSVHGKIGNGLKNFIKYIKTQLEAGVEVVIDKKPTTMEALLDPKNKTLDLAALVSAKTYGGEVAAHNKRSALQKARTEEPTRMKAVCDKIGCAVPKLSGSALEGENMENCYKLLTKKDLAVEKVQEQLVRLGYYKKAGISGEMKNVDGGLGPNTKKVIALFQTEYNQKATQKLPTNGELDNATKTAILGNQTQQQNTTPVNPVEPPKVTMPALMGDASFGCYH
jgi:peptidoglycan hydrolase-like protein with peptidoglycan-binding domain